MALKNQALVITYLAWNISTNNPVTGDASNHTLRAVGDGTAFTPAGAPVEVDSTNLKGVYKVSLLASEMNYNFVTVGGSSSTSNVVIVPVSLPTERGVLPNTAPATQGPPVTVGASTGQLAVDGSGHVVLTPAGLDNIVIETGLNARQAMSIIAAFAAGLTAGMATGAVTIAAAGNPGTTRITASADLNNDRTSVTLNPPA